MYAALLTLFLIVSVVLVIVVLLQSSKGGGLAGAFGAGGSDASFMGGRSASSFLTRMTTYLAGAFMVLALVLSLLSARQGKPEEGVIAKQQRSGSMQTYDVEEGSSLADQLETGDLEEGTGDGGEVPADGEAVPEGS